MKKFIHRKVRILLGGLARLVRFFTTKLGFKDASLRPSTKWATFSYSFKVDYYLDGTLGVVRARKGPIPTLPEEPVQMNLLQGEE